LESCLLVMRRIPSFLLRALEIIASCMDTDGQLGFDFALLCGLDSLLFQDRVVLGGFSVAGAPVGVPPDAGGVSALLVSAPSRCRAASLRVLSTCCAR